MSFIYYHPDCTTCRNTNYFLVEGMEEKYKINIDKRYTLVLPAVWGEEVKRIGGRMPFLYNTDTGEWLHVDFREEDMREKIKTFLGVSGTSND